jgi:hypothetical protein
VSRLSRLDKEKQTKDGQQSRKTAKHQLVRLKKPIH